MPILFLIVAFVGFCLGRATIDQPKIELEKHLSALEFLSAKYQACKNQETDICKITRAAFITTYTLYQHHERTNNIPANLRATSDESTFTLDN